MRTESQKKEERKLTQRESLNNVSNIPFAFPAEEIQMKEEKILSPSPRN